MSDEKDPSLYLAGKVGELSGVIMTFQTAVTSKMDEMKTDMKEKISRDTCELIVDKALGDHKDKDHKKPSRPPESGTTIKISGSFLRRVIPWVSGIGGGGFGLWALLEKLIGG